MVNLKRIECEQKKIGMPILNFHRSLDVSWSSTKRMGDSFISFGKANSYAFYCNKKMFEQRFNFGMEIKIY